ncbi:MAG: hypothetical protein QOI77_1695 [Blastocatellia bacterium]|jgi:hypothetical protein|nr:hypothetical protein [Blastocatellia bacterium]
MEDTEPGTLSRKPTAPTKRALIIESWERLGCTMIGEAELRDIQLAVRRQLGPGAEMSPAAIARVLADQGAELRHPEVIEFDARWREAKIETDSRQLKGLDELLTARPLQLKKAEVLIKKLEKLRQRAEASGDQAAFHQVRTLAVNGRQQAELMAKDRRLSQEERAEQAEIVEWLKLWIQTPGLFADWLELRRRSPEFQKKFSD